MGGAQQLLAHGNSVRHHRSLLNITTIGMAADNRVKGGDGLSAGRLSCTGMGLAVAAPRGSAASVTLLYPCHVAS